MRKRKRLVFVVNPVFTYGKEGWSPKDSFLSGTEESVREWSRQVAKLGHQVTVYYNGEVCDDEGVEYRHYNDYVPGDTEINVKYSDFNHQANNIWYLTNEFDIVTKKTSKFKGVIFPSKWASDNLGYWGEFRIVPHGYDSQKIKYIKNKKIPKQCLYCSAPERGLDETLEAWADVVQQHPDATLIVTYAEPEGRPLLPNVIYLGKVDEDTMNELYLTSDIWVYPCKGGELYCMSGIKAQASGCVPLYYPTQALVETVRVGVRAKPNNLVKKWVDLLGDENKKRWIRNHLKIESYPDWLESTRILLTAVNFRYGR